MSNELPPEEIPEAIEVPQPPRPRGPHLVCARCGSADVVEGVPLRADHRVGVSVPRNPTRFISPVESRGVLARVCGACGHLELYIVNPAEFVEFARIASEEGLL